jgi:hypothetical protein
MKARVGYQELFQAIVDKCDELGLTLNVTKVVSEKTMMSMFTQHQNQV